MEDDVQVALDLFSKSVAFGLLRPYPPEEAAWRTIHAALAARTREVGAMRTIAFARALLDALIAGNGADSKLRHLSVASVDQALSRALAAQEGTR